MSASTEKFCHWFEGVLDSNVGESGVLTLSKTQVEKIQTKLQEALAVPATGFQPNDLGNARC